MNSIHLISLYIGTYDGNIHHLRSFGTKDEAVAHVETLKIQIAVNVGKAEAVAALMGAWDEEHPQPKCPDNDGTAESESAYNAFCALDNAHRAARKAEDERLQKLVGYDTTLPYIWAGDDWHLQTTEVPFGPKPSRWEQDTDTVQ